MEQPSAIQVVFSDESLLVINKPAGISTLPDGYNPTLPHIKSLLEGQYGRLWIVHRLDKETSGILLLARTAQAHRLLNTQFEQRQVSKTYHAIVYPLPEWKEKTVDLPLKPNGDRQHRTVVDPSSGKPAVTHFKVLERFETACLLAALPETGRTHQIRAHLAAIGLYIIGDKLYTGRRGLPVTQGQSQSSPGGDIPMPAFGNMALHAITLELNHPSTGERMKFAAPYPPSMQALLQHLRETYTVKGW